MKTLRSKFNPIIIGLFIIGVFYVIRSKSNLNVENQIFWDSLRKVEKTDTFRIEVTKIIFPPGGRLSAESAPIETLTGERFYFRTKVNRNYDPSKSILRNAIDLGDSILFPFREDTILLQKQNGEMLFYRIIYPEK